MLTHTFLQPASQVALLFCSVFSCSRHSGTLSQLSNLCSALLVCYQPSFAIQNMAHKSSRKASSRTRSANQALYGTILVWFVPLAKSKSLLRPRPSTSTGQDASSVKAERASPAPEGELIVPTFNVEGHGHCQWHATVTLLGVGSQFNTYVNKPSSHLITSHLTLAT